MRQYSIVSILVGIVVLVSGCTTVGKIRQASKPPELADAKKLSLPAEKRVDIATPCSAQRGYYVFNLINGELEYGGFVSKTAKVELLYRFKREDETIRIVKGFISPKSQVCDTASVRGYASLYGEAKVAGSAVVSDWAQIHGQSKVLGKAQVYGYSEILGSATVKDKAKVFGNSRVFGDAEIYDRAQVSGNVEVMGFAKLYGSSVVSDNSKVHGNAHVFEKAKVNLKTKEFFIQLKIKIFLKIKKSVFLAEVIQL